MYPLKFEPVYKEKIWGGTALADQFNRDLPGNSIGESWEIVARDKDSSKVANGKYTGWELMKVIEEEGTNLLGTEARAEEFEQFPLLIKLLDANDKLSVQVHPDQEYAAQQEKEAAGKTEMWYVLAAEEEAKLVYGVKPEVDEAEFAAAIEAGKLQEKLVEIDVEAGDVLYIPAGTVHAIEEGILLAEIQQNSDTTYRVYDWDRVGDDGEPRELHVGSALDVIDFDQQSTGKVTGLQFKTENITRKILVACPHFITETWEIETEYQTKTAGNRYYILMGLEGKGKLVYDRGETKIKPGETVLVPADLGQYKISGNCKLICSYQQKIGEFKKQLKQQGINQSQLEQIAGLKES